MGRSSTSSAPTKAWRRFLEVFVVDPAHARWALSPVLDLRTPRRILIADVMSASRPCSRRHGQRKSLCASKISLISAPLSPKWPTVGRSTADDVVHIVQEEASEDALSCRRRRRGRHQRAGSRQLQARFSLRSQFDHGFGRLPIIAFFGARSRMVRSGRLMPIVHDLGHAGLNHGGSVRALAMNS